MPGSRSEDPATNLALNLADVAQAAARTRPQRASGNGSATALRATNGNASSGPVIDLDDRLARKIAAGVVAAPWGSADAQAAAVRQAVADTSTGTGTSTSTGTTTTTTTTPAAGLGDLELEASGPNVLGLGHRSQLARATLVMAFIAVLFALVVLFADEDTTKQSLALIILSGVCVVVSYLTTMGFGTVRLRANTRPDDPDNDGSDTDTDTDKS